MVQWLKGTLCHLFTTFHDSHFFQITNQMIETCKQYITCRGQEPIWSQEKAEVRKKLQQCIQLNQLYRKTYVTVKTQPFLPNQTSFNFSENYVFGKFDTFCERLEKILKMFDMIDDYNGLFERRMEGNVRYRLSNVK